MSDQRPVDYDPYPFAEPRDPDALSATPPPLVHQSQAWTPAPPPTSASPGSGPTRRLVLAAIAVIGAVAATGVLSGRRDEGEAPPFEFNPEESIEPDPSLTFGEGGEFQVYLPDGWEVKTRGRAMIVLGNDDSRIIARAYGVPDSAEGVTEAETMSTRYASEVAARRAPKRDDLSQGDYSIGYYRADGTINGDPATVEAQVKIFRPDGRALAVILVHPESADPDVVRSMPEVMDFLMEQL